jgi:hypothetical protein
VINSKWKFSKVNPQYQENPKKRKKKIKENKTEALNLEKNIQKLKVQKRAEKKILL